MGVKPVWARKHIHLATCPKSYITPESIEAVEDFLVRRQLGRVDSAELTARQVEAFIILQNEVMHEINDGQHNTRHTL